jgi:transposase
MKNPIDPNVVYSAREAAELFSVSPSTVTRWAKARRLIPVPGCQRPLKFLGERLIEFARGNASMIQAHQRRAA